MQLYPQTNTGLLKMGAPPTGMGMAAQAAQAGGTVPTTQESGQLAGDQPGWLRTLVDREAAPVAGILAALGTRFFGHKGPVATSQSAQIAVDLVNRQRQMQQARQQILMQQQQYQMAMRKAKIDMAQRQYETSVAVGAPKKVQEQAKRGLMASVGLPYTEATSAVLTNFPNAMSLIKGQMKWSDLPEDQLSKFVESMGNPAAMHEPVFAMLSQSFNREMETNQKLSGMSTTEETMRGPKAETAGAVAEAQTAGRLAAEMRVDAFRAATPDDSGSTEMRVDAFRSVYEQRFGEPPPQSIMDRIKAIETIDDKKARSDYRNQFMEAFGLDKPFLEQWSSDTFKKEFFAPESENLRRGVAARVMAKVDLKPGEPGFNELLYRAVDAERAPGASGVESGVFAKLSQAVWPSVEREFVDWLLKDYLKASDEQRKDVTDTLIKRLTRHTTNEIMVNPFVVQD